MLLYTILIFQKSIDRLQAELTNLVRENTKRLDTFTVLHQANRELEANLDSRQKNLVRLVFSGNSTLKVFW